MENGARIHLALTRLTLTRILSYHSENHGGKDKVTEPLSHVDVACKYYKSVFS